MIRRALLKRTIRSIKRLPAGASVSYYTDTEQLRSQYDRASGTDFFTLPVPVNAALATRQRAAARSEHPKPTHIVFLGDARTEKGYHHLPLLVGALSDELSKGRVCFTFQSNFAFDDLRRDPSSVSARTALRTYSSRTAVRLQEGILDRPAYDKLLAEADVIVLPYDRNSYYARSSSVFVEGLAAGVPVLVPAGTWMSEELDGLDRDYHEDLIRSRTNVETVTDMLSWRRIRHGRWSDFRVQRGSALLILRLAFMEAAQNDSQVRIRLGQFDAKNMSLGSTERIVGAGRDLGATTLFTSEPGQDRVEIRLTPAFRAQPLRIRQIEAFVVPMGSEERERTSIGAVGRTFVDPMELPAVVREMIAHHSSYRAKAMALAAQWAELHSPDRLVAHLAQRRRAQ